MSPGDPTARWERVTELFGELLALDPEDRGPFLEQLRGSDAALADELRSLLEHHEGPGAVDAAPEALIADAFSSFSAEPRTPDRVGPYRVERVLGFGGMGAVYLGERADADFQQRVALKLVRVGFDSPSLRDRFLRERRILARLEHPNIARLVDGGLTEEGTPYFAMEFVDGVPVHRFADDRQLSIEERLRLFVQVCDAVEHAHRQLVVHRDLKPANVFVTRDGTIKLLDFGVAKLLEEEDSEAPRTRPTERWLTPEYASPEQIRGEPATTACDVYALGVLLYELLTGHRPFGFGSAAPHQVSEVILGRDPERPSTAVVRTETRNTGDGRTIEITPDEVGRARGLPPDRLRRRLSGDLDTIVLKAMQKDPGRRYGGAADLAQDLRNHLTGRPVTARPDSWTYRWGRALRRNRLAAGLAVAAAAALIAGMLGTAWQARRARAEASLAASERDRAARVADLMVEMFRLSDPGAVNGQTVTAREVLDQGAARILSDFTDEPALQADLLIEVGQIYDNLGLIEESARHFERALELRSALYDDDDPRIATAVLQVAHARIEQGRPEEALELGKRGIAVLRSRGQEQAAEPQLAYALMDLGMAHTLLGQPDESIGAYTEATHILEASETPDRAALARAVYFLADAAHSKGDFELADSLFEAAVRRFREGGGEPTPELGASLMNLGSIRLFRGQADEAERLMRQALEVRRTLYGDFHPSTAESLNGLANALQYLNRYDEARTMAEASVVAADSVWGRSHMSSVNARTVLGAILLQGFPGPDAVRVLEEADQGLTAEFGEGNARTIANRITLGQAYAVAGERERARELWRRLLATSDENLGPEHPFHAFLGLELARQAFDDGDLDRSAAGASDARDLVARVLRPDHRFALGAERLLGRIWMERGQLAAADSVLRRVWALEVEEGSDPREAAVTETLLADVALRDGRLEEAAARGAHALGTLREVAPAGSVRLAEAQSVFGAVLAAQGRVAEARPLLRDGAEGLRSALGPRSPRVRKAAQRRGSSPPPPGPLP
ncbi:MAG: tetratricopeptide repeat protein [Gemmatimonadota bacterium]